MSLIQRTIAGTSVLLGMTAAACAQQAERPNLVLFIADDCSYYDLGCYGSPDSRTPNIDRFASQGMRFTRAYQAAPMSSPTRHCLYTGLWPVCSGAYPNHTRANRGTRSVVHQLHPQGYRVALVGKSHVAPDSVFPWDVYAPSQRGEIDFDAVRRFISDCEKDSVPYCLLVATNQPHTPWDKGDASQFDADKLTIPPMYVDIPQTREAFIRYLAEINYMDGEFGTLLGILDEKGQADKSVVVYLSEQGNSLPFAKWTCYDAGVHSACIVRWPGVVQAGSVSDAIVEYLDIVPTFVDIAGGKPMSAMDGESFKEVLTGRATSHKEYTFALQTTRGINAGAPYYGIRSVSDGHYRYIVNLTPEATFKNVVTSNSPLFKEWQRLAATDEHAKWVTERYQHRPATELYDVTADPYCMNNLAGDKAYADIVARLDKELRAWMARCGDEGQPTEMQALKHLARKQKADKAGRKNQKGNAAQAKKKNKKQHKQQ